MPYEETYPADEQMHEGGAPGGADEAMQRTAALFEQLPPEVGFVLVDIALNQPEVFEVLIAMPPEELQKIHQMYAQALEGGQEPAPEAAAAPPADPGGHAYM